MPAGVPITAGGWVPQQHLAPGRDSSDLDERGVSESSEVSQPGVTVDSAAAHRTDLRPNRRTTLGCRSGSTLCAGPGGPDWVRSLEDLDQVLGAEPVPLRGHGAHCSNPPLRSAP